MKTRDAPLLMDDRRRHLLANLGALVPCMQARAIELDRAGDFPAEDLDELRRAGALSAPLPMALGGLGLGTEPSGARAIMATLRLLGRGNLSVGRVYEAHVNALRLIVRYGSPAQASDAADAALAGHLFGLWVTDAVDAPVGIDADGFVSGAKNPCSAAGHATRALITARDPGGCTVMLSIALDNGARADMSGWDAHGMRASASGRMDLQGLIGGAPVGTPGDYLRQPDFSAGAWRASAVTLGGMEALSGAFRDQLVARGRDSDPHQRVRAGEAIIAQETARMWVHRAALLAETYDSHADDVANGVNLARIAVETACLGLIERVQRGLGMGAFRRGTLTELLFRDLAMYLRQPAPDETLTEAAAHFMQRDLPALP